MSNILEAVELHRDFVLERNRIPVLRGVSLAVREGETLSIMGASGAGKSTLLHILGGLDRATSGQVLFRGRDLEILPETRRAKLRVSYMGFVFQAYYLLPELTVLENVMLPARALRDKTIPGQAVEERALHLLKRVGLDHRARHRPAELSGGEQQRAALARALINNPVLLLADEPTGNLDSANGRVVLDYLMSLSSESGHTLVMVTHNEQLAALCGRRLKLRDGRIEE